MDSFQEVTPELIQELHKSYEEEPKYEVARNAAVRQGLMDSMIDHDKLKGRVHVYNCGVMEEGKPVTNQRSSGRCWLFAFLNAVRIPFIKKFDLFDFEFSQAYLFFWDKIERTNYLLEVFIQTRREPLEERLMGFLLTEPYNDGGQWDMIVNLVKKYGLVPKVYYPETHSSEASRNLNKIISNKLREYCCRLRGMTEATDEELRKEKLSMLKETYRICVIALGVPPTTFDWEYKSKQGHYYKYYPNLTPKSFYENYVKQVFDVDSKICLINDPRPAHDFHRLYTVQYLGNMKEGYPVRYINLSSDDLKKYAIASLRDKEPVWFGCDVGAHLQRKSGLNDLQVYDTMLHLGVSILGMTKAQRLQYGESLMTHAMLITAVQLKDQSVSQIGSVPVRWRVENSWGTDCGQYGYLMATDDWFTEYVYEIVIDKKYVPQEVVDVLKQEAVVLPPWDPMGALASN